MNALGVGCALFLLVNGAMEPGAAQCGCKTAPVYRVQLKLVEVRTDGGRDCARTAALEVVEGRSRTAHCALESMRRRVDISIFDGEESEVRDQVRTCDNAHLTWNVNVVRQEQGKPNVSFTVERNNREGCNYDGHLPAGKKFSVKETVRLGNTHRFVLTRDHRGLPTSWVEVLVENAQAKKPVLFWQSFKPAATTGQEVELCPFWYEPF